MKRVCVTGASGFIGRRCLQPLADAGFEVFALSRHFPHTKSPDIKWRQADLFDLASARRLMRDLQPSHLLHLAWITTPGQYWTSDDNDRWLSSGETLLDAFVEQGGVRAIMTGTCAEYDWSGGTCHEFDTPLRPTSAYSSAKCRLHDILRRRAETGALSAAWARVFFPYGPGEPRTKLVTSTILSLLRDTPAQSSSGMRKRDFIYLDDVAAAMVHLLESDVRGPVNIGTGEAASIGDVMSEIARQLNRPECIELNEQSAEQEPPLVVADVRRLHDEVGYRPRWTLAQGIADTIAACRRVKEYPS